MAYNGYLIATTGADLNGTTFPLFFPCYADEFANWLSTEFVYLLAAMYLFIPPGMLSAHILSATLVYLAMLLLGLLAARISGSKLVGAIVCFTAIVTPWLFDLSRLVQETSVLVLAVVLFLLCLHNASKRENWLLRDPLLIALTLGMITYAYAGGRVLGPLFAFGLILFAVNKRQLFAVVKTWVIYGLLLIPTFVVYFTRDDVVVKRFRETTLFNPQESYFENIARFVSAYFHDLGPLFLLLNGDPLLRHHIPGNGMMLAATFLLSIAGLIIVIRRYRDAAWWRFVLYGLTVSVLPGAITSYRYHTLRLLALPVFLLILSVPALVSLVGNAEARSASYQARRRVVLGVLLALTLVQAIYYQKQFREVGPTRQIYFNAAYPVAFEKALAQPQRPIYLQDGYHGPQYIHALWYGTLKGIDLNDLVRIPSDAEPRPNSVVLSSAKQCTRCSIIFLDSDVTLYKSWGPQGTRDPADGARIMEPAIIGTEGSEPGQLLKPSGIASAGDGSVFIADSNNGRIVRFDSYLDFLSTFGRRGSAPGEINHPAGVAADVAGNTYVTDAANHKLLKFDPNGNFISEWMGGDQTFYGPRDVAIGPDGKLYILDSGRDRIVVFDTVSEAFAYLGERGSEPGQLSATTGITVADQFVVVSDTGNARIQVFDLEGGFVRQWPVQQWKDMEAKLPDIVFDDVSRVLYVSNNTQRDIIAFDLDGNPRPGIKVGGEKQLYYPSAMTILKARGGRYLLVLDGETSQIFKFDLDEINNEKAKKSQLRR